MIVFPLTLQTITIAPMMSICGKGGKGSPENLDEEIELVLSDVAEVHLELDGDLEREEQLVFLEDARAAVVVDVVRQRVHDVAQATMDGHVRGALTQRKLKHLQSDPKNIAELSARNW